MQGSNRQMETGPGRSRADIQTRVISGLGWFSIGLGLAEVAMPSAVAALIGVKNTRGNRRVLRMYGAREVAAGAGILTDRRNSRWLWGRVAGDVVDLSSLALALTSGRNDQGRLTGAIAAVAGVTALDLISAQGTSDGAGSGAVEGRDKKAAKATKAIAVDRSPEEAYNFWHDIQNLPNFMTYLESVQRIDDRRSHWKAKGPGGMTVEWDAEIVRDEPNRLISWSSLPGASFPNAGTVSFERLPGQRGTMIRAEMEFAPPGGPLSSLVGKVLEMDIGSRIQHDLRNFKQLLEIGEVTQSDASIHPGMHPARPAEMQHA